MSNADYEYRSREELLWEAAAPTLARIRRDRERAPAQVRPLLAHLETHLFDPVLDAKRLKQACGVRDNSIALSFHHVLGRPPYGYIEDCRMEVACRLLSDTDLKVWQIAQDLGYSMLQVFSRAFARWAGLRPLAFRANVRRQQGLCTPSRRRSGRHPHGEMPRLRAATLIKAVRGELPKDEADELSRQLSRLYPESFAAAGTAAAGTGDSAA